LHLDLSDIDWPLEIQEGLSGFDNLISVLFILYIMGIAALGLNILLAPFVLFRQGSQLVFFSRGVACLSFLSIAAASALVTFAQFTAVDLVDTYGGDIGLRAYVGQKYMVITWMTVLFVYTATATEMFRARISSWSMVKAWSGIYEGHGLEYANAKTPGPIHLPLKVAELAS
jgi:hypothetical protein